MFRSTLKAIFSKRKSNRQHLLRQKIEAKME